MPAGPCVIGEEYAIRLLLRYRSLSGVLALNDIVCGCWCDIGTGASEPQGLQTIVLASFHRRACGRAPTANCAIATMTRDGAGADRCSFGRGRAWHPRSVHLPTLTALRCAGHLRAVELPGRTVRRREVEALSLLSKAIEFGVAGDGRVDHATPLRKKTRW